MDIKTPKKNYLNYNWDNILRIISRTENPSNLRIDLSAVEFLRPETVIMLIVLSHKINTLSSRPVDWINLNSDIHSYLDRLDMGNISFVNIPPIKKKLVWNRAKYQSNNLTELKIITNDKECADTIKHIKSILSSQFPEKISSGFCMALPALISEIAGNSLEHSEKNHKGICYFLAQKYQGAREKNVVIAFGDCGIGIRGSLQTHNEWLANNDVLAIRKAFIDGVTSRKDKSGGLGFKRVKSVLGDYDGEIVIRSGRGVISFNPHKNEPAHTSKFFEPLPGTQSVLIL